MNLRLLFLSVLLFILSATIFAQNPIEIALNHVERSGIYEDADLLDIKVTDQYQSKHNGLTHIYLRQRFGGIEIDEANMNFNILENGSIVSFGGHFIKKINQKINAVSPTISSTQALQIGLIKLGIESDLPPVIAENIGGNEQKVIFDKSDLALENIPVRLIYVPVEKEGLKLAWELSIYEKDADNWWIIYLDALTGEVLQKRNQVLHCTFERDIKYISNKKNTKQKSIISIKQNASLVIGSYRVYAFPVESPNHGSRTLEISPWDNAGDGGTLGWHDDGNNVSNYSKGNNVDAYEDTDHSNNPTGGNAARVDGGSDHEFDFTLDLGADPITQQDPILTNLFYWNNIMHDVMYQYGFDEPGGNFQEDNLERGGLESDYVRAEAQDGSGTNNANFSTPVDGSNPRMQMFLWDPVGGDSLDVNAPENVAGDYIMVLANFGGDIDVAVTGDIVEVDDGSGNPSEGCDPLTNGGEISGNIALVDRGDCQFGTKCLNAQNAGAIAVIVCNDVAGNPTSMGGGADGNQVTIPAVMIRQDDCATIRLELNNGLNATLLENPNPPPNLDSDLDNGVIVHEYGHGISIRLTGGPGTNSCLNNAEQMGEGWSDFFAIWITTEASDEHADPRGMGTYLLGQPTDGNGIRPTPYSTDFSINGSTYGDIQNTSDISRPHGIGYLWCTMIWDLNWALINAHGFDADFYNSGGSSGNTIALQLVMDGLKGQPCSPGFEDGRNAILDADTTNNGGANGDIIWNVFARRGMGYSADQGSSSSRTDGSEAFDLPPGVTLMTEEELFDLEPLPVELVAFNALANDREKQIELYWNTASETNNKGFEIQRRSDEKSGFETIAWMEGAGQSFSPLNYKFDDKNVVSNTQYYYQLKQVDYDGTESYSDVVTASLNGLDTEVEIYPNPSNDLVILKLSNSFSGIISLKIMDAKGQLIDSQSFNSGGNAELEINFLNQPEGVYFIQIEMQNKIVTKRVVVKR